MEMIIINPKKDFSTTQIKRLQKLGKVSFIETSKYQDESIFKGNTEKVVAVGPELVEWEFPNEFIREITNLKAVCIPTTGFSWIDGEFLRSREIDLTNVPKYSTESVAEYAISLMLNLTKKLPLIIKNKWQLDYDKHMGWEVKGKTMGVIGLGSIGTRIAELGKALGMDVIYWSKNSRDKRFKYMSLKQLVGKSDFIFPAMARNKDTKKILNRKVLNSAKRGSFVVSITGEDLFDINYVLKMVKKGKFAGLAFESEKHTINNLKSVSPDDNVFVTPSVAWFTKEANKEDIRIWVENIESAVKGKPHNVVN